jgi:hypothetical protein
MDRGEQSIETITLLLCYKIQVVFPVVWEPREQHFDQHPLRLLQGMQVTLDVKQTLPVHAGWSFFVVGNNA